MNKIRLVKEKEEENKEKMGRRASKKEKGHINKELILNLLKGGAVLGAAIVAPGTLRLFKNSFSESPWREYYPSSIKREALKLWRKGFVEVIPRGEQTEVRLTRRGRVEVLRYNFDDIKIKKEGWDGKWRMVIFDIPDRDKIKREILREKLKSLGFFPMQESVFVFPYPCEREIKFIREVLEIPHFVKLLRVDKIENDKDLRTIFRLR